MLYDQFYLKLRIYGSIFCIYKYTCLLNWDTASAPLLVLFTMSRHPWYGTVTYRKHRKLTQRLYTHSLVYIRVCPLGPKLEIKTIIGLYSILWLHFIVTIYNYICLEEHLVSLISFYRFKRKTELTENYDIYTGQQPLVSSHLVPSPWFWWARSHVQLTYMYIVFIWFIRQQPQTPLMILQFRYTNP